jgi:hypothetical protein
LLAYRNVELAAKRHDRVACDARERAVCKRRGD